MQSMTINDQISVGGQPTEDDVQTLAQQGFKSVVNFRTDNEDDQPLSPHAEGEAAKAAGLAYLHVPVSMKEMGPELVDQFREQFPDLPRPVFAHCKTGKRAGAMVMMDMAVAQGMTGDQTLAEAEKVGFECNQPQLEQFVKDYVDSRSRAG